MRTRFTQRALLVLGFLLILVGSCVEVVLVPSTVSYAIEVFSDPIGYGLIGWAWWQWITSPHAIDASVSSVRRLSRYLAWASIAFASGYVAYLVRWIQVRAAAPPGTSYPHFRLVAGGTSATILGFCLAALGFWLGSNAVGLEEEGADGVDAMGAGL